MSRNTVSISASISPDLYEQVLKHKKHGYLSHVVGGALHYYLNSPSAALVTLEARLEERLRNMEATLGHLERVMGLRGPDAWAFGSTIEGRLRKLEGKAKK